MVAVFFIHLFICRAATCYQTSTNCRTNKEQGETTAPSVSNKQTTTTEPAQVKAEKPTPSAPKVQTTTAENAQDDIMTFDKANE